MLADGLQATYVGMPRDIFGDSSFHVVIEGFLLGRGVASSAKICARV